MDAPPTPAGVLREDIKKKVESKAAGAPDSLVGTASAQASVGSCADSSAVQKPEPPSESTLQALFAGVKAGDAAAVDSGKQCYERATQTDALSVPSPAGKAATSTSHAAVDVEADPTRTHSFSDAAAVAAMLPPASDASFRGFLSRASRAVEDVLAPSALPGRRYDAPLGPRLDARNSALAGRHAFDSTERASTHVRLGQVASDGRPVGDMDWNRSDPDSLLVSYAQRTVVRAGTSVRSVASLGIPRPTDGLALVWDIPTSQVGATSGHYSAFPCLTSFLRSAD